MSLPPPSFSSCLMKLCVLVLRISVKDLWSMLLLGLIAGSDTFGGGLGEPPDSIYFNRSKCFCCCSCCYEPPPLGEEKCFSRILLARSKLSLTFFTRRPVIIKVPSVDEATVDVLLRCMPPSDKDYKICYYSTSTYRVDREHVPFGHSSLLPFEFLPCLMIHV